MSNTVINQNMSCKHAAIGMATFAWCGPVQHTVFQFFDELEICCTVVNSDLGSLQFSYKRLILTCELDV